MLLDLGESQEGVLGLLAVSWHHSLLCVLALLLSPPSLCCLHLHPDLSVYSSVLSSPSVLMHFRCFSFYFWLH